MLKGGSLSSVVLQGLLKNSYEKSPSSFQDYQIDESLSGERVQVYYNPKLNQAVVVHRGSAGAKDWLVNDAGLLVGFRGKRFSHAQDIQNKAEKKYGAKNVTTIGHSLGAKIAEEVGQNSKEVITLNKPTVDTKKVSNKQYDIRTGSDVVSGLSGIAFGNKNKTTIPSGFRNPVSEHSTDVLSRLGKKKIGRGGRRSYYNQKLHHLDSDSDSDDEMEGGGPASSKGVKESKVVPIDFDPSILDNPLLDEIPQSESRESILNNLQEIQALNIMEQQKLYILENNYLDWHEAAAEEGQEGTPYNNSETDDQYMAAQIDQLESMIDSYNKMEARLKQKLGRGL